MNPLKTIKQNILPDYMARQLWLESEILDLPLQTEEAKFAVECYLENEERNE